MQVPGAMAVTVVPVMEHADDVVEKVTALLEPPPVAVSVKVSPNVVFARAPNVMTWFAFATLKVRVT